MSNIKEIVSKRNNLEELIKHKSKELRSFRKQKKELDSLLARYMESNNLPGLKCNFENSKKNAIMTKEKKKRAYIKPETKRLQCKQLLKNNGIPSHIQDTLLDSILETAKGPLVVEKTIASKRLK
tara:strand:- start:84 stop:458 length:375 start_codon:yes stop_codon:yes gene_type:complete